MPPLSSNMTSPRTDFIRIIKNIGWLFFDKILRLGVGLYVGVWVARYLGPQQYGMLSYAFALTAIFDGLASLGLNGIVVRDLVRDPDNSRLTLGSALFLQLAGGILALILSILTVVLLNREDKTTLSLVIIASLPLLFKFSDVVKYWFEARIFSRDVVLALNTAFIISSCIKIWLITNNASILQFAWVTVIESALASIFLILLSFFRSEQLQKWRFTWNRAKSLLNDSWPIIISSMSTILYMKIDQIMLGNMLGNDGLGVYSAAARISEAWYAIPTAINASFRPSLIKLKQTNNSAYNRQTRSIFTLMIWLSLTIAIAFQIYSNKIITFLYGSEFKEAGDILSIHIWTSVFVFINNASWNWFFAEDKLKEANKRTIAGILINATLNYLLIPKYGIYGAALSALAARAYVGYIGNIFSKETRPLFFLISKSIIPSKLFRSNEYS